MVSIKQVPKFFLWTLLWAAAGRAKLTVGQTALVSHLPSSPPSLGFQQEASRGNSLCSSPQLDMTNRVCSRTYHSQPGSRLKAWVRLQIGELERMGRCAGSWQKLWERQDLSLRLDSVTLGISPWDLGPQFSAAPWVQ